MRLRARVVIVSIVALATVVVIVGITDGFGTGTRLQANVPGWYPDGAAADTFWDSPLVDVPGVSLTGVHCHGSVQYELNATVAMNPRERNTRNINQRAVPKRVGSRSVGVPAGYVGL